MSDEYRYIFDVYRQFLAESEDYRKIVDTLKAIDDPNILPDKFKQPFEPTESNISEFINIQPQLTGKVKTTSNLSHFLWFQYIWFQDIENESAKKCWDRIKNYISPYIALQDYDKSANMTLANNKLYTDLMSCYRNYHNKYGNDDIEEFIDYFISIIKKYNYCNYLYLDGNILNMNECNLHIYSDEYKRLTDEINEKKQITLYNLFKTKFIITNTNEKNIDNLEDILDRYKKCTKIKKELISAKKKYNDDAVALEYADINPSYSTKSLNVRRDRRTARSVIFNVERCIFPGRYDSFKRKRKKVTIRISYD